MLCSLWTRCERSGVAEFTLHLQRLDTDINRHLGRLLTGRGGDSRYRMEGCVEPQHWYVVFLFQKSKKGFFQAAISDGSLGKLPVCFSLNQGVRDGHETA